MDSIYKVIEIIGTSDRSWDEAAKRAVQKASKNLKDLRVAEVQELDIKLEDGVILFRAKMKISFKYLD